MIKLRIDRKRWARGGINGDAALLNDDQAMCCLGFACRKLGVPEKAMFNIGTPVRLATEPNLRGNLETLIRRARTGGGYVDRMNTDEAVAINDDQDIDDTEREAKLKPVLAKLGFDVYFVG